VEALPAIIAQNPQAVYLLWGETHPEVRKVEGESYRESLWRRVRELGLEHRVRFMNHYMNDDEVVRSLLATDVYVSPALDPNQIVSGTLSYAVACGRVVVATGSLYAKELLADGRGIVIPFRNAQALAAAVNLVLADPELRSSIETAAYRYGRTMTWPRVARQYEQAFREAAVRSAHRRTVATPAGAAEAPQRGGVPLGALREALAQRASSGFPGMVSESLTHKL
jgi:glycosyltransferase involved in cell wall biosynthesis